MSTRTSPPPTSRRAGVAMIETVLTLPFIFVLLALIMYCGISMMRWHRVSTVDRYEAWRATAYAPGPSAASTDGTSIESDTLAETFFPVRTQGSGASAEVRDRYGLDGLSVAVRRGENQDVALTYLVSRMIDNGDATSELFQAMIGSSVRPLPSIRRVIVGGEFSSRFGLTFADDMDHATSRLDGDWRYVSDALDMQSETFYDLATDAIDVRLYNDDAGEPRPRRLISPAAGIREVTHERLDAALEQVLAFNALARELQDISLRVPAYAGPKLPFEAERLENGDWDFTWSGPDG